MNGKLHLWFTVKRHTVVASLRNVKPPSAPWPVVFFRKKMKMYGSTSVPKCRVYVSSSLASLYISRKNWGCWERSKEGHLKPSEGERHVWGCDNRLENEGFSNCADKGKGRKTFWETHQLSKEQGKGKYELLHQRYFYFSGVMNRWLNI